MLQKSEHRGKWAGQIVYILCPTTRQDGAEPVQGSGRVIAVGDSFRACGWADVVYSSSAEWFESNMCELRESTSSYFWCGDLRLNNLFIHNIDHAGMTDAMGAARLALYFGASQIVFINPPADYDAIKREVAAAKSATIECV